MNLNQLFEMQKVLDERIIREKGLEGHDLLQNKILALYVELGELANEWQGFKHWKVNPQPKDKMLEEFVDCLHFILSIGLKKTYRHEYTPTPKKDKDIINTFLTVMLFNDVHADHREWATMFDYFLGLGEMLGFTQEQIYQAYLDKNKVNHERQDNGY